MSGGMKIELDRACNDNGPGGVCTWCDELHTVTVVHPCPGCLYPPDQCRCNICMVSPRGTWVYPWRVTQKGNTDAH